MINNATQLKDKIKNINTKGSTQAQTLIRLFMMEHLLERISMSIYKDNFILKGGLLVTSLVGVNMRSTMDIDTTIRSFNLNEPIATKILEEIFAIDIGDNVSYKITKVYNIMEGHDYEGLRYNIEGSLDNLRQKIKVDISTGDAITPSAVEYEYSLLLENRKISLWIYNLETLFAEKMETVLSRSDANTRMRDFYDLHVLYGLYYDKINATYLNAALVATAQKRKTLSLLDHLYNIIDVIFQSDAMKKQWLLYQKNNFYAQNIIWNDIHSTMLKLFSIINP